MLHIARKDFAKVMGIEPEMQCKLCGKELEIQTYRLSRDAASYSSRCDNCKKTFVIGFDFINSIEVARF